MRYAGSSSWQITIGAPWRLLVGLFVRDAAGLSPVTGIDVPSLVPAVEVRAGLAPWAVGEAAGQWARWWEGELGRREGLARGFSLSDGGFGAGPELDALMRECFDDAVRWGSARRREEVEAVTRRGSVNSEAELVRTVEAEIGRTVRPFELDVTELPVAGAYGRRVSSGHVVVSRALRADASAYQRWLLPVIRELA
ncbi:hypothetical protein [Streptomyces sp. NBC_01190]|uniref:hypothetical protein n=1 Tax=Streptomyces sp. NBC_01190 TaxID=2903767 RepID=UPI0038683AAB|nr:hypothetical protein OG519_18240 [Streptomyces sp. NBC_01190]